MLKRKANMRTVLLTALLTITCLASPVTAGQPYYDNAHRFSIEFPDGWTVKQSSNPETLVKAVYRDTAGRIAQITIAAYPLPHAVTGNEADELTADDMWEGLKEQFPDFTVKRHDSGVTRIRSHRAVWNLIEITDPPQVKMIGKHYHFVQGKHLYRVTAVTDSGSEFFRTVLPTMEKSISTLAFGL
jgi:hypothetical protein